MVVFWGASSEGHTYSLIGINVSNSGDVIHKKKVSYGAINADVVYNWVSLQAVDRLLYIYLNDEIQGQKFLIFDMFEFKFVKALIVYMVHKNIFGQFGFLGNLLYIPLLYPPLITNFQPKIIIIDS